MENIILIVITAFIMDLLLGDPGWFPHPVKIIGWLIEKLEPPVRKIIRNQRLAGIVFACIIIGFSAFFSFLIIQKAWAFNKYFGLIFSIFLIYTTISAKDLKDETMKVHRDLERKNIGEARKNLSMVVGRDTINLNEKEVISAAVETIAENTNDGVIAPLFYSILGGPVLAVVYKVINTLDSMVGYKNEKYFYFGWFSAKLDDIANFIPARICGFLISCSSFIFARGFRNSFKTMLRYGREHTSPNSGISEAAMAGALGIRLGGDSFYNGSLIVKPYIGVEKRETGLWLIKEALAISLVASILMVVMGVVLMCVIQIYLLQ